MSESDPTDGVPGREARQKARVRLQLDVRFQIAGSKEVVAARTEDLSLGGMFVARKEPPPIGTFVRYEIETPAGSISGIGEVVWIRVRRRGPLEPPGMGIEFSSQKAAEHELLERMVREAPLIDEAPAAGREQKPLPLIPPPPSPDGIEPLRPDPPPQSASSARATPRRRRSKARADRESAQPGQGVVGKLRAVERKLSGTRDAAAGSAGPTAGARRTWILLGALGLIFLIWQC